MSAPTTTTGPKSPGPVVAFSWLDWSRDGQEYVAGRYRIRLVEPHRWEVLDDGQHLRFDERLSSALAWGGHHYIEALRRRDMIVSSLVVVASVVVLLLFGVASGFDTAVMAAAIPVSSIIGLSGLARFLGAATRNRYDPYRRRAPWEPRKWWEQDTLGRSSTQ